METIITQRARNDLRAIARYIARDNPRRAASFIDELTRKCDELASMPEAFPVMEGYQATGLRRRVHGRYVIFYYFDVHHVVVVHVLNASRDVRQFDFDKE